MLASEIIDRTLAEWLQAGGDERDQYDFLSDDIDSDTLEISLDGRVEHTPRDSYLEIEGELILTRSVTGSVVTAAQRGASGSAAVSHDAGTLVTVDPTFSRQECLRALRGIIAKLYPWGVYRRVVSADTVVRSGVMTAAAGVKELHSVTILKNTSTEDYQVLRQRGNDWLEFKAFDPIKFRLLKGATDSDCWIIGVGDWTLPEDETVNLTGDLDLPETLQEDLPMAVAGKVLQGREVPQATIDRIREMLARDQGSRPGAILNVGETLVGAFRRDAVAAERRRLSETDDPTFEWATR